MLRKCKRSLEMEHGEEIKRYKFPVQVVPTQDVRLLAKERSKISSHEVAEKEYLDYLKVKASQLRRETFLLTRELQKQATMCMELTDANSLLMDELKKICKPCVIDFLEAKNPAKDAQTD